MMTAKEIRESFLKFFASKGCTIVPSAPMVLKGDPTLIFSAMSRRSSAVPPTARNVCV